MKPRPYVRYTAAPTGGLLITLGMNSPTLASSEAPGHRAPLANDGNPATFWQAAAGDTNAWFQVDLERIVTVSSVKLSFPFDGAWRYRVEISDDGNSGWKLISNQTQTANSAKTQVLSAMSGAHGRFMRVSITSTPAHLAPALAELEVSGTQVAP